MRALLERPVKVSRILTTSLEEAKALEDPLRITMLEMLSEKPRSILDLRAELKRRGIRKAPTTLRHHLDLLKRAGLIELTRAEDVKGGVLKYYASKAKFLGHYEPANFEERFQHAIVRCKDTLLSLVGEIIMKEGEQVRRAAEEIRPCPYCKATDFEEYVIITLLNRAMAEAARSPEFRELLRRLEKQPGSMPSGLKAVERGG